jgi:hypothetical protein
MTETGIRLRHWEFGFGICLGIGACDLVLRGCGEFVILAIPQLN